MDGIEVREYLKLCQKHWRWIIDNYDRLVYEEGLGAIWELKQAYFDEYGLDTPESRCYLCELAGPNCLKCPLSGIAWRKCYDAPCVKDPGSVYRSITYPFHSGVYKEAKDAINEFLSIIDKECSRW